MFRNRYLTSNLRLLATTLPPGRTSGRGLQQERERLDTRPQTFSRSYKTFSANSKTFSANCKTFSAGWRQQRRTRPSTAGRPPPRRPSCLEERTGPWPANPLAPVGAAALVKLPRRRPSPMRVPERVPELASERVPERASSVRWSVRRRVRQSVLPARLAHAHSPGHASS